MPNPTRRDLLIGGAVLAAAWYFGRARPVVQSCPDGVNCPPLPKSLATMRRAGDVPDGVTQGIVLDLPPELRTRNWGDGSCVHASNVNLLKHQGQFEMAEWWRKTYSGGEYDSRLIERIEKAGLRYAFAHADAGEAFMKWCCRTRRGAGIFYKPNHSINLAGMDEQYAYLLDNNATNYPEANGHYERVPWGDFIKRWKGYGGFAWTLVYDPAPSEPVVG